MIVTGANSVLKYELTVGAQHMDKDFSFTLTAADAEILNTDIERHAIFKNILYFSLQKIAFGNGSLNQNDLQILFQHIIRKTLDSSSEDLAKYVIEKSEELRFGIEHYIKEDIEKLSALRQKN